MLSGIPKTRQELWDAYRDEIRCLFLEKEQSLPAIIETLKAQGFVATKSQLEKQLKKWNFRQRIDRKNWVAIGHRIAKRRASNKDSAVWISGVRVSDKTVHRQSIRYNPILPTATSPRLDADAPVDIRTPPAPYVSSFVWPELPFILFQRRLNNFRDFTQPGFDGLKLLNNETTQGFAVAHGYSVTTAFNAWVRTCQTAIPVFEESEPESDRALTERSTGLKFRELVKTLVFQLSNNLRIDDSLDMFLVLAKAVGPANLPLLNASRGLSELSFLEKVFKMALQQLCGNLGYWSTMLEYGDPERAIYLGILRWALTSNFSADTVVHIVLKPQSYTRYFVGPLQVAAMSMAADVVELLLKHNTPVDSVVYSSLFREYPLELALRSLSTCSHSDCPGNRGSERVIRLLLDAGAGSNEKARDYQLLEAVRAGNLEVAKVLLNRGANLHSVTTNHFYGADSGIHRFRRVQLCGGGELYRDHLVANSTVLTAAAEFTVHRRPGIVPVSNAHSDETSPAESRWHELDSESTVLRLLRTLIEWMEAESQEPLLITHSLRLVDVALIAAARNHNRVLSWLIEMGVDVLSSNSDGVSPLLVATREGNLIACQLLLDNGALNRQHGTFALHAAVAFSQNRVLKKLISAQADIDARPDPQEIKRALNQVGAPCSEYVYGTALHTAMRISLTGGGSKIRDESIMILMNAGASLVGEELAFGARIGNPTLVRLALAFGASPNEINDSKTCLQVAFSCGQTDIARILLQAGANLAGGELVLGVRGRNADLVHLALAAGASPNERNNSRTCLYIAFLHGETDIARILLQAGADLVGGELVLGVRERNADLVHLALAAGASPHEREQGYSRETCLEIACTHCDTHILKVLLQAGAALRGDELFLVSYNLGCLTAGEDKYTAYVLNTLSLLEHHGADPQRRHQDGASLLEWAYSLGNLPLIRWATHRSDNGYDSGLVCAMTQYITRTGCQQTLLSLKNLLKLRVATHKDADAFEGTALSLAALSPHPSSVISLLLSCIPPSNEGCTPFDRTERLFDDEFLDSSLEAGEGNKQYVLGSAKLFMEHCFWRNSKVRCGSPLIAATVAATEDPARMLLNHGLQADRISLLFAVGRGSLGLVESFLIGGKQELGQRPQSSHKLPNPLLLAVQRNDLEMIRFLLRYDYDLDERPDHDSPTPLQEAVKLKNWSIASYLLDAGADVNARPAGDDGHTVLQYTAAYGNLEFARKLLDRNVPAKIDGHRARGENGRTALESAAEYGRLDMVQLLLSSGAKLSGTGQRQYVRAMQFAEDNDYGAVLKLLRDRREWECEGGKLRWESTYEVDCHGTTVSECSDSDCSEEHQESEWECRKAEMEVSYSPSGYTWNLWDFMFEYPNEIQTSDPLS
ncbi:ankyrin repeat-containing domain protein [Stachybotrys elegans]|uniref:Ankyrin repeat-containing domain protein n=1 Tax=Stachybotrys elegans TaxID=80388 RepID=A0A8K0SKE5_9HYPO|nr:ankyrin repeat-containing domain protein [Stachybotrys elegans]